MAKGAFTLMERDMIPVALTAKVGGKTLEDRQRQFAKALGEARRRGINRWYERGGDYLLEWVKRHHKTNEGEPLHWDEPFQEEYYLLLGNPWVVRLIIEKAAQMGFSESLAAMAAFLVSEIRIPSAMGFEVSSKVTDMVGDRIQPSFDYCDKIKRLRAARFSATGRRDTDSRRRKMTVGGVPLTFFYAGTKSNKANSPERQASSAMSSFTAWVILADEIELWPVGALDIAAERQSACPMETKPFRGGSTPGQEGGIVDSQIKSSGYIFEWHVDCPHCGAHQALNPLGNLIKSIMIEDEEGHQEESFLDISGKPYDWFCHDDTNRSTRIETTYIGCSHCGKEMTREALDQGRFETAGGVNLREFCAEITRNRTPINEAVSLRLPRLASHLFHPANRIRTLLTTLNPADQLQQGLGLAISVGGGKISLPKMLACVDLENPLRDQEDVTVVRVMGVDQGRASHHYVVEDCYLPKRDTWEETWLDMFVEVITYGEAAGFQQVKKVARTHGVHLIGIDNEPEVSLAAQFARENPLKPLTRIKTDLDNPQGQVVLMDQVALKGLQFRRSKREVHGTEFAVYAIDRTFGLDSVRNRIYKRRYSLPEGTNYVPGDNSNFIYHFLTSDRHSDGKWTEPKGVPDHYFHAENFAQMALLAAEAEPDQGFYFTGIERN